MNDHRKIYDKLDCILYDVTYQMLKSRSKSFDFIKSDAEVETLQYREYLVAVLLSSGSGIDIRYMVHFWLEDAKQLLSCEVGEPIDQIDDVRAIDYLKEYCNLVAGKTKMIFEQHDIILNNSLPIGIDGFNLDLFTSKSPHEVDLHWQQSCENIKFDFSLKYTINNEDIFKKLENLPKRLQDIDHSNDIEFF